MKITRSREHTINMGSYESLKVGASVELEIEDSSQEEFKKTYTAADQMLSDILAAELKEAAELLPAGSQSYILSWRNAGTN